MLVMQDVGGEPTALGSGFVLRGGLIVTNCHVIAGAARGYVRLVGKDAKYAIQGTVAVDDTNDLALVAVTDLKAPALPLADSSHVVVGDDAYAVGNPQGLEGTFSQGIISAIRHSQGVMRFQITAPISPGSSGGPILDTTGKVIGIAVGIFTGGQNLNLAIPSSYLLSLTNKIAAEVTPLRSQPPRPNTSVLGDLDSPAAQGVVGENLSWTERWWGTGGPESGDYTLSLRNQLQQEVRQVKFVVIFFDQRGRPLAFNENAFSGAIPAGLAVRVRGSVDGSVRGLETRFEIRVLDFRIGPPPEVDESPFWKAARDAVVRDPTGAEYGEFMGELSVTNPAIYKRINAVAPVGKFDARKYPTLLDAALHVYLNK
ncbi:MAG TPA: serine protease [Bryobacteraceae bacterium]|nr:serine protease [Bryobacteraceae bacterium]